MAIASLVGRRRRVGGLALMIALALVALIASARKGSVSQPKTGQAQGQATGQGGGASKVMKRQPKQGAVQVLLLDRVKQRVRLDFQLVLRPGNERPRPVSLRLSPRDLDDPKSAGLARLDLLRPGDPKRGTRKLDGRVLKLVERNYSQERKKWLRASTRNLQFWPVSEREENRLTHLGDRPQSWHGRPLAFRVELHDSEVRLFIEGRLFERWPRTDATTGTSFALQLDAKDELKNVVRTSLRAGGLYESIDLSWLAREQLVSPLAAPSGAVPFVLPGQGRVALDLGKAGWIDQKSDPDDYLAAYDSGPYTLNDVRMPMISVPKADYVAVHVLASAEPDPTTDKVLTLRIGSYGGRDQVLKRDYTAVVPTSALQAFSPVRVPLTDVVAQDIVGDLLDVEITKSVRLARHLPDPNRFDKRPLGLPSGVRVAAVTFEKSPLQMRVSSEESGNAFVAPKIPIFGVELENISGRELGYGIDATATHLNGRATSVRVSSSIAPGARKTSRLVLHPVKQGYHDLVVELRDGSRQLLLRRTTSFAQLPEDTRRHRASSPFGTWEWNGKHATSTDSNLVGSLYQKLGFRFGMSTHPPDIRRQWGVLRGVEPKLDPTLRDYQRQMSRHPDSPKVALQFHEDIISARHAMRVPDLFTDRPTFEMNSEEKERYARMLDEALQAAKLLREKYPDVKISFGNGVPTTKEAFFRRGFPAHAFDVSGNEAACFQRLPETQPPDFVALNASLWMDRQLLDAYGYRNKALHQSYETCYPGDNPGNLTSRTQADYFVRHALHSLAWGMDFIHIGMLMDTGNSYYHSNWGAAGFCRAVPEVSVKPAFVAMATLTRVLDGAKFVRAHSTGSHSLYALEFVRPDRQRVLAFWTVRGQREVLVKHTGSAWGIIDAQGDPSEESSPLVASTSPSYMVGQGQISAVVAGRAQYSAAPPSSAVRIASFGREAVRKLPGRSPELEDYDFMTPRRKGDFSLDVAASFEGRGPALRVTPKPLTGGKDTMPMYERLFLATPRPLPGKPNEIGVWVNGNSGWGRIIFELRDAQGERWVALGAEALGGAVSDWNTDDPYGLSAINFDGWRYVAFPLPGNYPGEAHPWPANSNWRWSGDGVVQYPLALVGVAVTLRSKVLHVTDWTPVRRQSVYLNDVLVGWNSDWLD